MRALLGLIVFLPALSVFSTQIQICVLNKDDPRQCSQKWINEDDFSHNKQLGSYIGTCSDDDDKKSSVCFVPKDKPSNYQTIQVCNKKLKAFINQGSYSGNCNDKITICYRSGNVEVSRIDLNTYLKKGARVGYCDDTPDNQCSSDQNYALCQYPDSKNPKTIKVKSCKIKKYFDSGCDINPCSGSTPIPGTSAPSTSAPIIHTPVPTAAPTYRQVSSTAVPTTYIPTSSPICLPTTLMPTTLEPTIFNQTTRAPTTLAPTTAIPTTQTPSTLAPTTAVPSTQTPSTLAPTIAVPSTQTPSTLAPTTAIPTTQTPSTLAPTTSVPSTQTPSTLAPTTAIPTTQTPSTLAPTTAAPSTQTPSTLAPTTAVPETPTPNFPYCGNGIREGVEACDDAETSNNYRCLMDCSWAYCGDGYVWTGVEDCDPGHSQETSVCNRDCTFSVCGDGILNLEAGEECDNGSQNGPIGGCSSTCKRQYSCGNGITDPGEQCDAGNSNSNSSWCLPTCYTATCGDGNLYPVYEQCDDGNQVDTDSCTGDCRTPFCGDGITGPGEECDDGRGNYTGLCLGNCRRNICGDGWAHYGIEECDAGFSNSNTGSCTLGCRFGFCGDGFIKTNVEECDDGNLNENGACVTGCKKARCGDGFVHTGVEVCDQGALNGNGPGYCLNDCSAIQGPGSWWTMDHIIAVSATGAAVIAAIAIVSGICYKLNKITEVISSRFGNVGPVQQVEARPRTAVNPLTRQNSQVQVPIPESPLSMRSVDSGDEIDY